MSYVEERFCFFRASCGSDPFCNLMFRRPRRFCPSATPAGDSWVAAATGSKMTSCDAELMAFRFSTCARAPLDCGGDGPGVGRGEGGDREAPCFFNQPPPLPDRSCHLRSVVMEALPVLGPGTPQRRAVVAEGSRPPQSCVMQRDQVQ